MKSERHDDLIALRCASVGACAKAWIAARQVATTIEFSEKRLKMLVIGRPPYGFLKVEYGRRRKQRAGGRRKHAHAPNGMVS